MKKLTLLLAFFACQMALAQVTDNPQGEIVSTPSPKDENEIYNSSGLEVQPEFPGGIQTFYKFIMNNFKQPEVKNFKGGKVIVQFVVDKDGSLTDIRILEDCGFGTAEESIKLFKSSPKWKPAMHNGRAVRCVYMQTLN